MNARLRRKFLAFSLGLIFASVLLGFAEMLARRHASHSETQRFDRIYRRPEGRERETQVGKFGILPPAPLRVREEKVEIWNPPPLIGLDVEYSEQFSVIKGKVSRQPTKSRSARATIGERLVYEQVYAFDAFHRRITPGEAEKVEPKRFLMLLGDSNTFGMGVGGDETVGHYIGREEPSVRVYNYGMAGVFPGQHLDWLRDATKEELPESRGTILYFWADHYLYRNMLALNQISSWGQSRPYYYEGADGKIVADQLIMEVFPVRSLLAGFCRGFVLCRWAFLEVPYVPEERDYVFMVKLIEQIKEQGKRLGADQFYFVTFPGGQAGVAKMLPLLDVAAIRYIDYRDLPLENMTEGLSRIPCEGHYSAEGNEAWAREVRRLRFLFEEGKVPY